MLIYFVLLVIVVVAANIAHRSNNQAISRLMFTIVLVVLAIVPGIRNRSVGTDAGYYVFFFDRTQSIGDVFQSGLEPGYFILSWLAHFISDNYISIFFLVSITVALCFVRTIKKYSLLPGISFFILLVSGAYYVSFNGARQGIACAISFLAIGALLERRKWIFLLYVTMACSFHLTAVVILPCYLIVTKGRNLKAYALIVFIAGFGIIFFEKLIGYSALIDQRYLIYGQKQTEGSGLLALAFLCSLFILLYYLRGNITQYRAVYEALLKLFFIGIMISVFCAWKGLEASGIRRFSLYFVTSEILIWPIVIINVKKRIEHKYYIIMFILFIALYIIYYALTLRAFSNLVPFTINPLLEY